MAARQITIRAWGVRLRMYCREILSQRNWPNAGDWRTDACLITSLPVFCPIGKHQPCPTAAKHVERCDAMQSQHELDDRSGPRLEFGASWFIEQWLQGSTPLDPNCNAIAKRRHKRGGIATPPPSHGRALSPAKRRRTVGWTSEDGAGFGDPENTPTAKSVVPDAPSLPGTALT